jgi:hypothetical protein
MAVQLGPLLIAVLIAGCAGDPDSASVATTSAPPTSQGPQTASPSPSETDKVHVLSEASDDAIGVTVTVPGAGWIGEPGGWVMEYGPDGFEPPAGAGIIAFVVDKKFYVYGDPCEWKRTRPDTPATSVTGIVDALANQAIRDPSKAKSIRVGGYPGKKITLRVPEDARFNDCDEGTFATFGVAGEDPALYAQGPEEIDEIWVVNVEGRVVLLDGGYYPETRAGVVEELHDILSSATFD